MSEAQERDVHVLLWKCYKLMKYMTPPDEDSGRRMYSALYRMVADRVHDDDFAGSEVW